MGSIAETTAPRTHTNDQHRPQYHFLPPANWLNDPNGLIQWGDEYHMFYQYNPNGPFHGTIHWGHAVSDNLVHWRHLPIALAPTPGSVDEDGCWSGCAVNNDGVPTLIYSGASPAGQRACMATSDDSMLAWRKHPSNPVIAGPPPGLDLVEFRDHSIWREDGVWYQIIGSGIRGRGGAALLYRSDDLLTWQYLHPLAVGDAGRATPVWTGAMWECPDFFALGERHVLVVSVWAEGKLYYSAAMVGQYRDQHFVPEVEHKLDYGDLYFYAPQSFGDSQGRRVIFGWIQEARGQEAQQKAGWSGVMSLPRVLGLNPDGSVAMRPVPELETLRAEHVSVAPGAIAAGQDVALPEVSGDALELRLELDPADGGRSGIAVRRSPDGAEQTRIMYDSAARQLIVDRSRASHDGETDRTSHVAPLELSPGEPARLRIFLDRSVIEVFANERVSITSRIYPTRTDSVAVALLAEGGDARLSTLDAWRMRSIWAE